jgi:hypothetical protein
VGEGKDISDVKIYAIGFLSCLTRIIVALFGRYDCSIEEMGDVVT